MEVTADDKARRMRVLGWFMIGIGAFLILLTTGVGLLLAFTVQSGSGTRLGPVFVMVAMAWALGIVAVVSGVYGVRSGGMPKWLMGAMGALFVAMLAMGMAI